jgi:hypothetical protein
MRDDIALCKSVDIMLLRGSRAVESFQSENDGAALFYVKSLVSDGSDYRLSLHCAAPASLRTTLSGESDVFAIESAPDAFLVSAPDASTEWPVGTLQAVSWSLAGAVQGSEACDDLELLLIRHGGSGSSDERLVQSLTLSARTTGPRYEFYVPGDSQPGTHVLRVQCAGDTALGGESQPFRIAANPAALEVRRPLQGTECLIGHSCVLEWASSVAGHSTACAELLGTLVETTRTVLSFRLRNERAATHAIYLPGALEPSLRAQFELRCAHDPALRASSRVFKLAFDEGSFDLLEPHAASRWTTGQTHTARWLSTLSASPNCSTVDVDLLQDGVAVSSWPAVPNSGSLDIYLPGSMTSRGVAAASPARGASPDEDGRYALRMSCGRDEHLTVTSARFAIVADPSALTFQSPTGTALWTVGSVEFVEWQTSKALREAASCEHLDLTLRRDGRTVQAARAPNTGRYALYLEGSLLPSSSYSLSLQCSADTDIRAESAGFTIAPLDAPFAISAPDASSEWVRGQAYAVRWASPLQLSDRCATVVVELRADDGTSDVGAAADASRQPAPSSVEVSNSGRAWLTVSRSTVVSGAFRVCVRCSQDRALSSCSEPFAVRESCGGTGCADAPAREDAPPAPASELRRAGTAQGGLPADAPSRSRMRKAL